MTKLMVDQTAKIEITGSGTVANLKSLLDKIPENAKTSITILGGGPGAYEIRYLKFDWSEEL